MNILASGFVQVGDTNIFVNFSNILGFSADCVKGEVMHRILNNETELRDFLAIP